MSQSLGTQPPQDTPFLDVLSSGSGPRLALTKDVLVLGRAETCDVRFDNLQLSPTHAAIRRREDGALVVEDLGSALGTYVNGVPVTGPTALHPGDVITLADVVIRLETDAGTGSRAAPAGSPAESEAADGAAAYADLVVRHREALLAEAAATRARGRRLVWIGALLFALGCLVFGLGALAYTGVVGVLDRLGTPPDYLGWRLGGLATGHIGWAVAALGLVVLLAGVLLQVLARRRARRVDRHIPPPAWQPA